MGAIVMGVVSLATAVLGIAIGLYFVAVRRPVLYARLTAQQIIDTMERESWDDDRVLVDAEPIVRWIEKTRGLQHATRLPGLSDADYYRSVIRVYGKNGLWDQLRQKERLTNGLEPT